MNIKEILANYRRIAVIGFSDNENRDSNRIAVYMYRNGYEIYGVNPKLHGKNISGIKCFKNLESVAEIIDIVNIFRTPDAVPGIVDECVRIRIKPKVIWTQLGIINHDARKTAEAHGFIYIENKCLYIEHKLNS